MLGDITIKLLYNPRVNKVITHFIHSLTLDKTCRVFMFSSFSYFTLWECLDNSMPSVIVLPTDMFFPNLLFLQLMKEAPLNIRNNRVSMLYQKIGTFLCFIVWFILLELSWWQVPNLRIFIFSNYWMRLSSIWRTLQIKEGVIHRGRKSRWITPNEICRILDILRKPTSIIALLIIHSKYFPVLKGVSSFRSLCFLLTKNNKTSSPRFLGQRFSNLRA